MNDERRAAARSKIDEPALGATAFALSLISAAAYFAASQGIHNFLLSVAETAQKSLRLLGWMP